MGKPLVARDALRILSLHAKMHARLDTLSPYEATMRTIEVKEIMAYDDDRRYTELELLKQELLNIRFVERQ